MSKPPLNKRVSYKSTHRCLFANRIVRLGGLLLALTAVLVLGVTGAHAAHGPSLCLLIETDGKVESYNLQTYTVQNIDQPPSAATPEDPPPYIAYSPDGKHLAKVHGVEINGLSVEPLAQPYHESQFGKVFAINDSLPAVVIAWSPNSQWIAYEGYKQPGTVRYLALADVHGKLVHSVTFDSKLDYFSMNWSADSQYLMVAFDEQGLPTPPYPIALYHIPDLKAIDLGAGASSQVGSCFERGCWAVGTINHRRAYAAPVPDQPNAMNLILLDAATPDVRLISIPRVTDETDVGIAPNGAYVAVTYESISTNDAVLSVPLWIYWFDGTKHFHLTDIAATAYMSSGRMGGTYQYPEIAWASDGNTLYYITYAENSTRMQFWAYEPAVDKKVQIGSWPTVDAPDGYSFYVSHDKQRVILTADPHWHTTTQLLLPGGKLIKLLENSSSSDWSPDDRYIALGQLDYNAGTLMITVFDNNGQPISYTSLENMQDSFFLLTWRDCKLG